MRGFLLLFLQLSALADQDAKTGQDDGADLDDDS